MVYMPHVNQKSVTIPLKEWKIAVCASQKEEKNPTRWIREQILRGANVEQEVQSA